MNNRLKEIRTNNHLTLKEVGEEVGLANNTLSQYENGKREPKLETWQALADYFNVSVPYLQGIEDKPNSGYSKDYIYQCLDSGYKEEWKTNFLPSIETGKAPTLTDVVNNYARKKSIAIPEELTIDFWKNNFSFIFDNRNIKRLLTTKDEYSDNEIKSLIFTAIFEHGLDSNILKVFTNNLSPRN